VPPPVPFIPDSLTYAVALFLKRQCDRTLDQARRRRSRRAPHGLLGPRRWPLSGAELARTKDTAPVALRERCAPACYVLQLPWEPSWRVPACCVLRSRGVELWRECCALACYDCLPAAPKERSSCWNDLSTHATCRRPAPSQPPQTGAPNRCSCTAQRTGYPPAQIASGRRAVSW
jgi:hypothetical protein